MTNQEIQDARQIRFLNELKAVHLDLILLRNSTGTVQSRLIATASEAVQNDILAG